MSWRRLKALSYDNKKLVRGIVHLGINLCRDDSTAAEVGGNVRDICNVGCAVEIAGMMLAP